MYGKADNTVCMMEFTEILENHPDEALDYIVCNRYRMTKDGLADILEEILRSFDYHCNCSFYERLFRDVLNDARIELDERYDGDYQEYQREIDELNKRVLDGK